MGVSLAAKLPVSKTGLVGSNPTAHAIYKVFAEFCNVISAKRFRSAYVWTSGLFVNNVTFPKSRESFTQAE